MDWKKGGHHKNGWGSENQSKYSTIHPNGKYASVPYCEKIIFYSSFFALK